MISFSKKWTSVVFYIDQVAHILVCLKWYDTMVVMIFVFRQDWVGRKVAGMKKTFFAFFDWTCTHILALKVQIKNFLNSILVKKDRNYIIINFVTLRLLNKVKLFNIISFFAIFDPNRAKKKKALTSLKFGSSSYNCHKFSLMWFYNHCFLL